MTLIVRRPVDRMHPGSRSTQEAQEELRAGWLKRDVARAKKRAAELRSGRPVRRRGGPDRGLRKLFREHLPAAQWTTVETGSTTQGVPDSEYCFPGGAQGWVEYKATGGWVVKKTPAWTSQVGWLDRRARLGGRAYVAVRRCVARTGVDELWLFRARDVKALATFGLRCGLEVDLWAGGPARWDWAAVEEELRR